MPDKPNRRYLDVGLLVLRVGIGITFLFHGGPKMFGGPGAWTTQGQMVHFPAPAFFGFMAAFAEFAGGISLILGLFLRPFAALLLIDMIVAIFAFHLVSENPILNSFAAGWAHPLEDGIVFLSLIVLGAGQFSLDHLLWSAFCVSRQPVNSPGQSS